MLTMAQIAKDHNVSDMTVIRIFDKCILPQLALKMSEIICIDDDSTDSSMQKLEYFSCKDSRIQIFKKFKPVLKTKQPTNEPSTTSLTFSPGLLHTP